MQQIEELKKQLEMTDQQSRQVSDEQKKFEKKTSNLDAKLHHLEQMLQDNDTKYREEIKSILVEMKLKENHHEAMCRENKVHINNIEKLNNNLLCTEEKLHQQKLQQNSNEEELKKQVEVLSQQLNARDKNFSEISSKNKELSEDLEKVTRKLSEVELQLEKQQQRDAQHQQQDVKSCQQIKLLLQRLNAKDKQCKQIALKNTELSEELKKLSDKFSEVELQLQDQRQQHELQKQKDVKTCQEVEVLSQRSSVKDEHLNELTLRNNVLSQDLAKLGSRRTNEREVIDGSQPTLQKDSDMSCGGGSQNSASSNVI
uniref:Uncharacterized protein n=1 Tax=Eptatretus burgeri TaxID=7764 RepID=A0A8C4R3J6_EPTBU